MKRIIVALGLVLLSIQSASAFLVRNEDEQAHTLTVYPYFSTPLLIYLGPKEEYRGDCKSNCAIKIGEGSPINVKTNDLVILRGGVVTVKPAN